ncbi:MAG TPA: hypothetical protein P5077_01450 [bacterium]|nr:hypothetical protein [bacterium]
MKERLIASFAALSSREKNILVVFGAVLVLFAVGAVFLFFDDAVDTRREEIAERRSLMEKVTVHREAFRRARDREAATLLAIQNNETNLNSYLNGVRETYGVEISTIKELKAEKKGEFQKEMIEVGIRSIEMDVLMSFLYALEDKARFVFVPSISIKKRFDGKNYEVTMIVATLKEAAEK